MKTFRLGLSFIEMPEGGLPGPPRAHIFVKRFSDDPLKSIEGPSLISAECVSFTEVEYQIDELKRELDTLKTEARNKFTAADKREQERWARRHAEKGNEGNA